MVVLVILGLVVGLVSSISRPDDRALLRLETERLAQLLDLAAQESRLSGKRIAWTADATGYRFWRFAADTDWSEIRDVDTLRPRKLPSGMKFTDFAVGNGVPRENMRLEFSSSGSATAFAIRLAFGEASDSIEGTPMGEIRLVSDESRDNVELAPQR